MEGNRVSILITDDSIVSRKKLKVMLKDTGYEISLAKNGREALSMIDENQYDLMLLDLLMPDITGVEVLKHLNEEHNDISVIVVSADIQDATRELCFKYGAKAFLNKPPSEDELIDAINKALSENRGG
jgi:CheY-like chemotaxis protein